MSPNDLRHGTLAGYRAGCRLRCCKEGINRYHKVRDLKQLRGQPLTALAPALGTQRRLQALMALGWSLARLQEHTGIDRTYLRVIVRQNRRVAPATAVRIATAYDALSMTFPSNATRGERQGVSRTLRYADEHGFVTPLAWDDIDRDEQPATASDQRGVDWVVVERVLAGDVVPTTTAERHLITDRWLDTGRSWNDLEALTGWRHGRYGRTRKEAA